MKKLMWLVYLTAVLVSSVGLAFGAEAPYTFQSVDITVPRPSRELPSKDLNFACP
jgi:hypothetical protein